MTRKEFSEQVARFVADRDSRTDEIRELLEEYHSEHFNGDFVDYINRKIRKAAKT